MEFISTLLLVLCIYLFLKYRRARIELKRNKSFNIGFSIRQEDIIFYPPEIVRLKLVEESNRSSLDNFSTGVYQGFAKRDKSFQYKFELSVFVDNKTHIGVLPMTSKNIYLFLKKRFIRRVPCFIEFLEPTQRGWQIRVSLILGYPIEISDKLIYYWMNYYNSRQIDVKELLMHQLFSELDNAVNIYYKYQELKHIKYVKEPYLFHHIISEISIRGNKDADYDSLIRLDDNYSFLFDHLSETRQRTLYQRIEKARKEKGH